MLSLFLLTLMSIPLGIAVWLAIPRRGMASILGVCCVLAILWSSYYHWTVSVLLLILAYGGYSYGPFTSLVRHWGREEYRFETTGYCVEPSGAGCALVTILQHRRANLLTNFDFVDASFTRIGGRGGFYKRPVGSGAVTFTAQDLHTLLGQVPPERRFWNFAQPEMHRRRGAQEPATPSGPWRGTVDVPVSLTATQPWWLRVAQGPQRLPHTDNIPVCHPSHPHFRQDGIPLFYEGRNILVALDCFLPRSQQTHSHWWHGPVQVLLPVGAAVDGCLLIGWLVACGLSLLFFLLLRPGIDQ